MIGVAKPLGWVQQPFEKLLALNKRRLAKIVSIAIKQIENVVHDRRLGDLVFAWSSNMHAFLQAFEVAVAPHIKRDNLSIEDCVRSSDRVRKRSEFRVTVRDVQVVTRAQRQLPASDPSERAHSVPLDLEQPVGIGERSFANGRQHWTEA